MRLVREINIISGEDKNLTGFILIVFIGMILGVLAATLPRASFVFIGILFFLIILRIWLRNKPFILSDVPFLILLAGTFALGRSFSILGVQVGTVPVFVTEGLLALTLLLIFLKGRIINVLFMIPARLRIALFIYFGLGIPYLLVGLLTEGKLALRDIVFTFYVLFLFITLIIFHNEKRVKALIYFMIPVSLIALGIGAIKLFSFDINIKFLNHFISQTKGFNLTLYYGIAMVFAFSFFLYIRKGRFFLNIFFGLCLSLIVLLQVRTAWVASIVAFLFLGLVSKKGVRYGLLRMIPMLLLIAIMSLIVVRAFHPDFFSKIFIEAQAIFNPWIKSRPAANIRWRFDIWKQTFIQGLNHPIFGGGFGAQPKYIISGRPTPSIAGIGPGSGIIPAHNYLLGIFYKMGLLGLTLFLFINLKVFLYGLSYIRKCRSEFNQRFLVASLASVVYWHGMAFFFDVMESPPTSIFLWILLGLVFAIIYIDKHESNITNADDGIAQT